MTLFLVPWSALQAELSEDYAERSTIVTFRFLFGWIGGTVFTWCTWTYMILTGGRAGCLPSRPGS